MNAKVWLFYWIGIGIICLRCPNGGTSRAPDQCSCRPGFSGTKCSDIDECSSGTARCSHTCTNTQGSFTCSCRSGYSLGSDRRTCYDLDECSAATPKCNHTCTNTQGSFRCLCKSGFTLASDGRTCSDDDECNDQTHLCDHNCTNEEGAFSCSCRTGYVLDTNNRTCSDVDECSASSKKCNHICTTLKGTYTCSCDDDECNDQTHLCDHNCTNEEGAYSCSCRTGYLLDTNNRTCSETTIPANMTLIVSLATAGTIFAVSVAVVLVLAMRRYRLNAETRSDDGVSHANTETVNLERLGETCENTEHYYSVMGEAEYCYASGTCQDDRKV
ncbi:fibulin-1-like [Mya arenaria]|uniref:fibulin-1-like n=1 Tax=Mya arenaria TaxID=6604 RepID=UPI0022E0E5CE|nr:fibulin-1-like [Mya arenaria]